MVSFFSQEKSPLSTAFSQSKMFTSLLCSKNSHLSYAARNPAYSDEAPISLPIADYPGSNNEQLPVVGAE